MLDFSENLFNWSYEDLNIEIENLSNEYYTGCTVIDLSDLIKQKIKMKRIFLVIKTRSWTTLMSFWTVVLKMNRYNDIAA